MTSLNTLQVMFGTIRFDILHGKSLFKEWGNDANIIRFRQFKNESGQDPEILFNEFTRNVHPEGQIVGPWDKIRKVRLPAEVMTKDCPATVQEISELNHRARESKANFRLIDEPIRNLLDGTAVMDVLGDRFKINWDDNSLVHAARPWRKISLEDLERVPGTQDLILPYDTQTKRLAMPANQHKTFADHVRYVLLPGLGILNARTSLYELGQPAVYSLIDYPIGSELKAVEIPYPDDVKALLASLEAEARISVFIGPDEFSIDTRNRNFVYDGDAGIVSSFDLLEKQRFTFTGIYDTILKRFVDASALGTDPADHLMKITLPVDLLSGQIQNTDHEYARAMNNLSYANKWGIIIKDQELRESLDKPVTRILDGNAFSLNRERWELVELKNESNTITLPKPDGKLHPPTEIVLDRVTHKVIQGLPDSRQFTVRLQIEPYYQLDPIGAARFERKPLGTYIQRHPQVRESFATEIKSPELAETKNQKKSAGEEKAVPVNKKTPGRGKRIN
jgi:hypothetical protein